MSNHTGHLGHAHHQEEDPLMTVAEVAKLVRVDDTTVRRWAKHGVLEVVVLPHANKRQAYRIRKSTVDRLLTPTTLVAEAV